MAFWNHIGIAIRSSVAIGTSVRSCLRSREDLRNAETCSWTLASNRRRTWYARAAIQAECGNTTWFPGAAVLLIGFLFVGAAMTKNSKTATTRANVRSRTDCVSEIGLRG